MQLNGVIPDRRHVHAASTPHCYSLLFFRLIFCSVYTGSEEALADCGFESFRKYLILIFY